MMPSRRQRTFLLAFTLLCTLWGLGYPLRCEVCRSDGQKCSGKLKTCDSDKDTCVIMVGESSTKGHKSVGTIKTCMKSKDCFSGIVSTTMSAHDYMVSNTHCCQTDACNTGSLPPPPNNRTENGLVCPSCVAPFRDSCSGSQLARCVGSESHCVYLSGNVHAGIIKPKFATRGCATESVCNTKAGAEVPSITYEYYLNRADCLPAPRPAGRGE
uniref:Phospholipase A2 inhibitor and LY6/PLAUR domain containing n=1 Tax=Nannospalax galili TaxID=1026970 RepID=A0A8C6W5N4_NANGA